MDDGSFETFTQLAATTRSSQLPWDLWRCTLGAGAVTGILGRNREASACGSTSVLWL